MHSHYSPAAERIYRIDAHSLHSLAPFVGGLSLQSVTATLRAGRNIGTRECSNVKPLRLHDTVKRSECGVCSSSDATHRCRFATHSFNGYRCCPIPPFAQTSFGKSFTSSLHSHVASKHRCCIDYTRCAVRRGTNSIPPMTAAAALLSSFVRAV